MDNAEADLGMFMDSVEVRVALLVRSDLGISLDKTEEQAFPLQYGIVGRVSFVQDRFCIDWLAERFACMAGTDLEMPMDSAEADLGTFMDSGETRVALVGRSELGMSLDKADARALPLRCGISRRVSLTQEGLVLLTQDSQFSGFWKALLYASSLTFLTSPVILDRRTWVR